MSKSWETTGDRDALLLLVKKRGKKVTIGTAIWKESQNENIFKVNRTRSAVITELYRLRNAVFGRCYHGDGDTKLQRMEVRRKALAKHRFKLYDSIGDTIIIGQRLGAAERTGNILPHESILEFSGVFELLDDVNEWEIDRETIKKSILDYKVLANMYNMLKQVKDGVVSNIKVQTIIRYLNGGKGYENGPPAFFKKFVRDLLA